MENLRYKMYRRSVLSPITCISIILEMRRSVPVIGLETEIFTRLFITISSRPPVMSLAEVDSYKLLFKLVTYRCSTFITN